MRINIRRAGIAYAALLTLPSLSCSREEPKPPNQAAVEQAWNTRELIRVGCAVAVGCPT